MKILQVISHYVPAYSFGGPLQVTHGMSKALLAAGHEVTVCTTNMRTSEEDLNVPLDQPVSVDGVKIYYEGIPFGRYWGYSPALLRRVIQEASHCDVIFSHFHFQFASMAAGIAARKTRKPTVVFTHGSLNSHGIDARGRLRKLAYINLFEKRYFRDALFMAYHSLDEMKYSLRYGQIELVPIGLDRDLLLKSYPRDTLRKRYPEVGNRFIVSYMGRLAPGKGLNLLILALSNIAKDYDAHLVFIGGDERGYKHELEILAKRVNVENRITFTGLLTGDDKYLALCGSDAFALPSLSEGLSVATLEAMAMRLPVIVSNRVGLWSDVIENACGVVIDYSKNDLVAAMVRLYKAKDREEMGRRGLECVREKYCWEPIVTNLMSKIQDGIAGKRWLGAHEDAVPS